jgi:hypothetical protein
MSAQSLQTRANDVVKKHRNTASTPTPGTALHAPTVMQPRKRSTTWCRLGAVILSYITEYTEFYHHK